jgi:opacity protein-like surface antigen
MQSKVKYGLMAIGSAVFAAILFSAFAAKAQSPTVYFGLHGGKTMSSTVLTNTGATFSLDGLSGNGYVAGVHVGADLQFANSPIFAGVFVGADWGNNEFKVQTFTATLGSSYYAGGRLGVVATGGTKIYALAAWRQSEWSTSAKGLLLDDPRGWDLGVGIDVPIAKNITLGVEGVATQYQKGEFSLGAPFPAMIQGPTGIHAQIDQLSVMARLSFQLGGNSSIFDDAAPAKAAKACDPKMGCK